jgi:hypothetical protein
MAMKPKKSDSLKVFGAGDPNYAKDMVARGRKSGKGPKVPNPNGDKLIPVKPKSSTKSKASKSLTGDKAIEAIRKRTSPKGVKEYEKGAKKALEKKYPGLYKKSK